MEEKEIIEEENKPSEKKPADGNFMKIILLLAMVFVVMYMVFGKGKNDDACIVVSQSPFGQSQKQVWIDLENKLQAKGVAGFDLEVPEELEQTYTNVSYRAFSYQISEVTFHDDNGEDVIRIDKAKFCGKDILTTDDNSYTNIQKVTIDGKDVKERGNGDKYSAISWVDGEYSYGITAYNGGIDEAAIEKYISEIK